MEEPPIYFSKASTLPLTEINITRPSLFSDLLSTLIHLTQSLTYTYIYIFHLFTGQ